MDGPRCGSLASSGLPDAVRSPLTVQELLPTPPPEDMPGTEAMARAAERTAPSAASGISSNSLMVAGPVRSDCSRSAS